MLPNNDVQQSVPNPSAGRRALPESTYRLQFHSGFKFLDATAIVPYLHELGITHSYASPYLKAVPGSTHGYDVIDHCSLNPEVGTPEEFDAWVEAMRRRGMSHILDTVPNHVGVATNENVWWNDVLAHGRASKYAHYFDITWEGSPRPELHDKVLLPVLGAPYGEVLERGELRVDFDAETAHLRLNYWDRQFPLSPVSYWHVCSYRAEWLEARDATSFEAFKPLLHDLGRLREFPNPKAPQLPEQRVRRIRRLLGELCRTHPAIREFIERNVTELNGTLGVSASFDDLDSLLNAQHYRVAYWRTASDEINYRRFFDVNDLAALSMERQDVFDATHRFTFELLREGRVAGLRIDHPDGLFDPKQYFEQLRERSRKELGYDVYVVAEKILAIDEPLPEEWPCDGTSGYDFLIMANGLFVDLANVGAFTRIYDEWTGERSDFEELVYQKKRLILEISLASELRMLAHQLDRLAQRNRMTRDFTLAGLHAALREVIACFPVYRSYVTRDGVHESDVRNTELAVERAVARNPKSDPSAFRFVGDVVLLRSRLGASDDVVHFAGKFQQLTAPTTAKGIEDTAFYLYNRLVSLNEVGGEPQRFGVPPEKLHAYFAERRRLWPYALSAMSTHDTKRSEDVRARINVLSEAPDEWRERVTRWGEINAHFRKQIDGGLPAPSRNDEYLLYQTLIGAWPIEQASADEAFVRRIQQYLTKAVREAKTFSGWTSPNEAYESAVTGFAASVIAHRPFLDDFLPFQRRVSHWGMLNSLAQTLLRIAAPGVPDTYQGTELWDFSLVDPDNRRPVDYERRRALLEGLKGRVESAGEDRAALARELIGSTEDGRVKLYLTWQGLTCRREHPGLFSAGEYTPVEITGPRREHVFAFARRHEGRSTIVAVPRLVSRLAPAEGALPVGTDVWQDTRLVLPAELSSARVHNRFTGEVIAPAAYAGWPAVRAADVFSSFPVALLIGD